MNPIYGKRCKTLAGFASEIAGARKAERKHLAERDLAKVALRNVKEERRDAIIREEMGDKHRPVEAIDADIKAASRVVELDEEGARAEAARRKVARLEVDREAFIRANAAELGGEIVAASGPAADAVMAAMVALEDAVEHRAMVAADLHQVVRVLPVPDARSTGRIEVPDDRVGGILRGAISRARAVRVEALVPWQFMAAAAESDDDAEVDETVEPVKTAQERNAALLVESERREAEQAEIRAAQLAAARGAGPAA